MGNPVRLLPLILFALPASAAELHVQAVDDRGAPVEAVFYVAPAGTGAREITAPRKGRSPAQLPPVEIRQKDKRFQPPLSIVEAGQLVRFPNEDSVFHNVFSVVPGDSFDLGMYKAGATPGETRFKTPGKVSVFCNIHSQMSATIVVVAHPYHARSDAEGRAVLALPAERGAYEVRAVDEFGNEASAPAVDQARLVFAGRKTSTPSHRDKNGKPYPVGDESPY